MVHEIKAWSYRPRIAHIEHTCRLCGDKIIPGRRYFSVVLSDPDTPSSEKIWNEAEHLDCRCKWHVPEDISPTRALSRLQVPKKFDASAISRIALQAVESGNTATIIISDRLQAALQRTNPFHQKACLGEVQAIYDTVGLGIEASLNNPEIALQFGHLITELQQLLSVSPDVSRALPKKA